MSLLLGRLVDRESLLEPRVRLLGLIPLVCWIFQYVRHAFVLMEPANLLWICHVTTLLLAIGLLASWASVVRVAAVWAIVGLPMWIIEVAARGYTSRVSLLSHIAVPIVAALALSQVKGGRFTVVAHAMGLFLVVQQVCRLVTIPALNINMAHKPYDAFAGDLVPSYPLYWALSTAVLGVLVTMVSLALRRLLPADVAFTEAVGEPVSTEAGAAAAPQAETRSQLDFNLAPKISPLEDRAAIAAAHNMPPPLAPRPKRENSRTDLVVDRLQKDTVPKDPVPRGFTLIEMCVVVAIIGIMTALAVPDLTPVIYAARRDAAASEVITFLERARRSAMAEGRCYRVTLPTPNSIAMARRTHANCFDPVTDTAWSEVANVVLQPGFSFAVATLPTGNPIVFRPTGRLRGDGDLDITDDGARIVITTPALADRHTVIFVTTAGRICAFRVNGAPAWFLTPSACGTPPPQVGSPPLPPSGFA
jgi:prepilin-type N-terminal cleavage/methylation domain-containing protein